MSSDIRSQAERRVDRRWEVVPDLWPFDCRDYSIFGFLADVRNYSAVRPISEPRGIPRDAVDRDWWDDHHSCSWLSTDELLAFDYDQVIEDRRGRGRETVEPGEGKMMTYREFLGEGFFDDLEELKASGAERIVFGFD
ncbi:hypothetical protein [Microvirga yunnanensis]|uniref:hypothetical protein n=1 Tax=Microvirga yunnanensis TaxID=2953740 RepID=UPI0021C61A07|nr:hypothetical protein [Microvirga sp. HBU67655]